MATPTQQPSKVKFSNKKTQLIAAVVLIAVIAVSISAFYVYSSGTHVGTPNLSAQEWNSYYSSYNQQADVNTGQNWHLFDINPQIRITNQGNGMASNVQVEFQTQGGQINGDSKQMISVGNIKAGDSTTASAQFDTGALPDWLSYPTYNIFVTVYIGNNPVQILSVYITPKSS